MSRVDFPHKLASIFQPCRYKILHGGRGSAKSWSIARALLILAASRPLRILCAREFQNSIRESVHKLLSDQIENLGLMPFYSVQERAITGRNGSEFIFEGLRHNATKIKSMEGIDIVWVEEAQTVSGASWDLLIPTIRAPGSEIWISFNPDLEEDETYQRFVIMPPSGALVIQMNWSDNPWFPDELRAEKDDLLAKDVDAHDHIWGGQIRKQVTNPLWPAESINARRLPAWSSEAERLQLRDSLTRIVVSVDPSGCSGPEDERSDEVGITVGGRTREGEGRLLADLSGRYSPDGWGRIVARAYQYWGADRVIAEKNFGGAMVESTLRVADRNLPVKLITASRGKQQRAEPIAALYEKGLIRHVGSFPELERQMRLFSTAGYQGKRSPDRADAHVWAMTELLVDGSSYDTSLAWV
ncbi:PBSX family phage terminase large subunit [Roseomonas mucosa]|uniref:PBSX family phage terminase large subunit n=1 Tax=Roseomonas mucosa TaxID=207340 RepID=UPI0022472CFE|nr:PBSX family phage terminase large subunit [Roseomonas mucosa]UZO91755.1 Terminase large subunit [Roseomonas mucosa]